MPTNIFQLKRYFVYALFVLAAVIAVFTVFQIVTAAMGHPVIMVVVGDSMLPALKPYDVVLIEPIDPEQVKVGEIVAIKQSSGNTFIGVSLTLTAGGAADTADIIATWQEGA